MALEPITRQEKIVAGQDLTPITRLEKFLKQFGGGGGSIPKPLTYDYMPEGYPKKDGWSVEWDGNIDGKINVTGTPLYKFSDRVLTYEEFLSAKWVDPSDSSQFIMVSETRPKQQQIADNISEFNFAGRSFFVVSEDNAGIDRVIFPTKGLYANVNTSPFKLIKETITPMSTDFIPKNLNVVFSRGSNSGMPDSCNVPYDVLRGWIENGVPVFAVYKLIDDHGSVSVLMNIMQFVLDIDSLSVYYQNRGSTDFFKYNPDGTISGSGGES